MKRTASCVCGQLSVSVDSDPELVIMCNCTDCQKRSGSAFQLGAFFKRETVAEIAGESTVYARTADSGRVMNLHFCPTCGVSVYFLSDARPHLIGIHAGCFGDPQFPSPDRAVWVKHKHDWVTLPDVDDVFEENSI